MLERLTVRTFKSLEDVTIDLGQVNVFIGANGSTPSKNIEAWVVAAVWPDNSLVRRPNWECRSNPEDQLAQLPKVRRFEKHEDDYKRKEKEIQNGWRNVSARLTEAGRFEREFLAAVTAQELST